jgi:hypothetical protein
MKYIKFYCKVLAALSIIFLMTNCKHNTERYSRGIGIYPGNPDEDFSPDLVRDNEHYRNIARLRPVYQSSSYDYNLTSQLVTDGIIQNEMPEYISFSSDEGELPKNEREWLLDHNSGTHISLSGNSVWIQYELNSEAKPQEIQKISLNGRLDYDINKPGNWEYICSGSNDGKNWEELGKIKGNGFPGQDKNIPFQKIIDNQKKADSEALKNPAKPSRPFKGPYDEDSTAPKPSFSFNYQKGGPQNTINPEFEFSKPVAYHFYRVNLSSPSAIKWTIGDFECYNLGKKLNMVPSDNYSSAWMSAGRGEEWLYVDLGSVSSFNHIKLYWINKAVEGSVQISDDAKNWKDVASLPGDKNSIDDIVLKEWKRARFVKILMKKPAFAKRYILSEIEILGKGGLIAKPKPGPQITDNKLTLSGGNWKIQRSSQVHSKGEDISKSDFRDTDWVVATVPGTVLTSYWYSGALPNPNFGDNILTISESFFNSDFWYRDEFDVPADFKGTRMYLNFDGINWKADIYINGTKAGRMEGAFIRGNFDVTDLVKPGQKNVLAVRIIKNANIGVIKEPTLKNHDINGGILGADNPTYHASIGWDWIPTIRGRNIGIWDKVYLTIKGPVTIDNPLVVTDLNLPDTTSADISLVIPVCNHMNYPVSGTLTGKYGTIDFEVKTQLDPNSSKIIKLNPATTPALRIKNPQLWWPKGYGKPNLYVVDLSFKTDDGKESDHNKFNSGIRKMTYSENNQIFNMYINGRRFIGRGGNWGFPESNLQYRGREYDAAVAYHADMNFNMIRNWVAQTDDDNFFDACDRYGIMIWQDFCLANPADGPDPDNPEMFLKNAEDLIKRIRNHPSLGIYVGRNEGNPPVIIDTSLRNMTSKLHPGLYYIPNSASGNVSGGGPYRALSARDYFLLYGYNKFHSERGMPNVMTYESLQETFPADALWPQNNQWGQHDFNLESAQSCASFNELVEKGFGTAKDAREFSEYAQWINYNGYRAIFEGRSLFRQGVLLWMSHPAWPSMVWQTYDYFLEPTAAYFGCKKASEAIHIQWNPVFDYIEVVNNNARDKTNLTASAQIINMDGTVQWEKEISLSCKEDSTAKCFRLKFPKTLSSVHFIKLTLKQHDDILSENFYWRGLETDNYKDLKLLPKADIETATHVKKVGDLWNITTTLSNTTKTPVLMIRLKVIRKKTEDRILPVFYSDNYVSLMPGETKVITMTLKDMDTRGERPAVSVSGFNLKN